MSHFGEFVCYLIAFVAFFVAATGWTRRKLNTLTFISIGLASWVLVLLWAAADAAFN